MSVGLYAPYNFSEQTNLACSLGDLARALGLPVSYLAFHSRECNVRRYWDRCVLSANRRGFKDWAAQQDVIVWFGVHRRRLYESQDLSCVNVLVADWRRIAPEDIDLLPEFHVIAAPCYEAGQALRQWNLSNVVYTPWYPGPRPVRRDPDLTEDRLKLYVNLDRDTGQRVGADMLSALHVLMSRRPGLEVTLALTRQWTKGALPRLRSLAYSTGRLKICKKQSYEQRLEAYRSHDWVFCPSISSASGYDAIEALVHGCPVVAFDSPPYNEFIQPSHNGALLRCPIVVEGTYQAPTPKPSANDLLNMLDDIARNPRLLSLLLTRSWDDLQTRSTAFTQAWKTIWDC